MDEFLAKLRDRAIETDVFGGVEIADSMLRCAAPDAAEEAWHRIERIDGLRHVAPVTPDRWLSGSIEADLMHTGDLIEELIEEEFADLGCEGRPLAVRHYPSEAMLCTFASPLPIVDPTEPSATQVAAQCLLTDDAAFRELDD